MDLKELEKAVGDGSIDPRDYLRTHEPDFIPVKSLKTSAMLSPSDGWFGDFDNTGVPEVAIGRVPVQTALGESWSRSG